MKNKAVTFGGAAVVLVVLGAATWLMLDSGDAGTAAPVARPDIASNTSDEDDRESLGDADTAAAAPMPLPAPLNTPTVVEVEDPGPPASYRAALGGISGRVVEADGTPVPGLTVEIIGGRQSLFVPAQDLALTEVGTVLDMVQGASLTDGDGRFLISDLEPRTMGAVLVDPGGPRTLIRVLDVTPAMGETRDLGDIELPASVTLRGRVVDSSGAPVQGARVRATDIDYAYVSVGLIAADYRQGGAVLAVPPDEPADAQPFFMAPPPSLARLADRLPFPATETGPDGRFVMEGVPPGLVTVVLDDGVHQITAHGPLPTGAAGGERDVGELLMPDGVTLHGQVVDDQDNPVPEAVVYGGNNVPGAPLTAALLHPPVTADAEGRFVIEGLRDGLASLAARRADDLQYSYTLDARTTADSVKVVVPGRRTLTITLLDDEGQPVEGGSFFGMGLVGGGSEWDQFVPAYVLPRHALDSRATSEEPGVYVISDMDPIAWRITARAPGHAMEHTTVELTDEDARIELRLDAAHSLEVLAVDAYGQSPVEWAMVEAYWDEDSDVPLTSGRTDASGRTVLSPLPTGEYEIRVTHPALAVTGAQASIPEDESLTVSLEEGGTIRGIVVEKNGAPPESLLLTLTVNGEQSSGDGELPRLMVTMPDGTFTFTNVQPGAVEIEVRERPPRVSGVNWFELFINSALARADIDMAPGAEVDTVLVVGSEFEDMETAWLAGRVTVNGRPAAGWKVRAWGEIRRSAEVDPDGGFDLGLMAAGENRVSFAPPSGSLQGWGGVAMRTVDLDAGAHEYEEFALKIGAISGKVRSAIDGRMQEGVGINAVPADEGERNWFTRPETVTLEDGSFLIEPVAVGTYIVRAEKEGFAVAASPPVEVREMQTARGIELRLEEGLTVTGRVVLGGLEELPQWMFLIAKEEGGARSESTGVNNDGVFVLDNLAPGTYVFDIGTGADIEFESITRTITGDTSDLVLEFVPIIEDEDTEAEDEG